MSGDSSDVPELSDMVRMQRRPVAELMVGERSELSDESPKPLALHDVRAMNHTIA